MLDFIDSYYYRQPIQNEDNDTMLAKQKALSVIVPLILENELTQRQYACLRYKYVFGKSQAEIADMLKLSQPTVSRHITAAKDIVNNNLKYCYLAMSKSIEELDRLANLC